MFLLERLGQECYKVLSPLSDLQEMLVKFLLEQPILYSSIKSIHWSQHNASCWGECPYAQIQALRQILSLLSLLTSECSHFSIFLQFFLKFAIHRPGSPSLNVCEHILSKACVSILQMPLKCE